jgi:hypothetical protein
MSRERGRERGIPESTKDRGVSIEREIVNSSETSPINNVWLANSASAMNS